MPPLRTVGTLSDMVEEWVWRWLQLSLELHLPPQHRLKQREFMVTSLNANIRQKLLNRVLSNSTVELAIDDRCRLLELLGDTSTQWVDLAPHTFVEEVFQAYRTLTLARLINLTRLGLRCNVKSPVDSKYIADVNGTFYRVLSHMKHLVWVTLTGVGDNTVLATLGATCPFLEHVNVSWSPRVRDEGVAALVLRDPLAVEGRSLAQVAVQNLAVNPCCSTLTLVSVANTCATDLSAVLLLNFVPRLVSLGGFIDTKSMCDILALLRGTQDGQWTCALTHLWDARILPHHVPALSAVCPALTALCTEAGSLPALALLPALTSLTLDLGFHGSVADMSNYLAARGLTLTSLILTKHINCSLDLSTLIDLTPNLKHLEASLYQEGATSQRDGEEQEQEETAHNGEMSQWRRLTSAVLTVNSTATLVQSMTRAPGLRQVSLSLLPEPYTETWEDITDEVLARVIAGGGLLEARAVVVRECGASVEGVRHLLHHCPHLSYLAPLINWPRLTSHHLNQLSQEATRSNWRLRLALTHNRFPA